MPCPLPPVMSRSFRPTQSGLPAVQLKDAYSAFVHPGLGHVSSQARRFIKAHDRTSQPVCLGWEEAEGGAEVVVAGEVVSEGAEVDLLLRRPHKEWVKDSEDLNLDKSRSSTRSCATPNFRSLTGVCWSCLYASSVDEPGRAVEF